MLTPPVPAAEPAALALACLATLCFGTALVTGALRLRLLDARSGAAFLREPLPPRALAGVLLSVAAIVYLVAA